MCKKAKKINSKKNKYIYQSYTNHYYNNNHYTIGNLFLPVLCVRLVVCVEREQELVKIFTRWQVLVGWQKLEAVSEAERCWGMFWKKNNGRTATLFLF